MPEEPAFVVGDRALQQDRDPDDDRDPLGRAALVRELEDPGRGDQEDAHGVVEHRVHPGWNDLGQHCLPPL